MLAVYCQLALNTTFIPHYSFKDKDLNHSQTSSTRLCRLQTEYSPPSHLQLRFRRQRDHLDMRQTDRSGEKRRGDAVRKYWMLQTAFTNCLRCTASSLSWWKADAQEITIDCCLQECNVPQSGKNLLIFKGLYCPAAEAVKFLGNIIHCVPDYVA
jgi:hypothetical protein